MATEGSQEHERDLDPAVAEYIGEKETAFLVVSRDLLARQRELHAQAPTPERDEALCQIREQFEMMVLDVDTAHFPKPEPGDPDWSDEWKV